MKADTPIRFAVTDVPEFQRLQAANPQNPELDSLQAAIMYGRAIHWISFLDILWPDFRSRDWFTVEVAYIVHNDPDRDRLPEAFYEYIAGMIAMLWRRQLDMLYPEGGWEVTIDDEPEISVRAAVTRR